MTAITTALLRQPTEWLQDPDWSLAHFTFVADMTTLREACHFACSDDHIVARYTALPFAAIAFYGHTPKVLQRLTGRVIAPDEPFYMLVNEKQTRLAEQMFVIEEITPEWQMLFEANGRPNHPPALDTGNAVSLTINDLPAMHALAEQAGLTALEENPLRLGPAFGVWDSWDGSGTALVGIGTTRLLLPGWAEIGNIATHPDHRRRGYGRQVVAALVQAHLDAGRRVFLMVYQTNTAAIRLYESMGFARVRPMFLLRCRLQ